MLYGKSKGGGSFCSHFQELTARTDTFINSVIGNGILPGHYQINAYYRSINFLCKVVIFYTGTGQHKFNLQRKLTHLSVPPKFLQPPPPICKCTDKIPFPTAYSTIKCTVAIGVYYHGRLSTPSIYGILKTRNRKTRDQIWKRQDKRVWNAK